MAATQVARNTSFNGFDEFVNMPGSPTLTPCPRVTPSSATPIGSSNAAAFNMRKVGLDEKQPPPPPGSSPEALFRYYLAVELRKAGTQPEEALLDRYVRNHFDSLFKNKTSTTAPAVPSARVSAVPKLSTEPSKDEKRLSAASDRSGASPPELDNTESPAYSGASYSPLATPPALDTIAEKDHHTLASSAATGSTVKYEPDTDQTLNFFRTSPFRMTDFESATIDPHFVENSASSFSMPRSTSSAPSQDGAPMSEDGSDEDDDDETKFDFARHFRNGSTPDAKNRSLNEIPMAVGSINYLKPDPEEYKKLSSKEKRQLRNKISARNFRTRRKEYITLLEEQISDRDNIIEGLRQQLSQMTTENKSLKEEVRVVKTRTISSQDVGKILEALQSMAPLQNTLTAAPSSSGRWSPTNGSSSGDYPTGPATPSAFVNFGDSSRPTTPTLAVPSSPRSNSPRPSMLRRSSPSMLPQANTKKDVGAQSSFWGGVGSANGNSFMPVC